MDKILRIAESLHLADIGFKMKYNPRISPKVTLRAGCLKIYNTPSETIKCVILGYASRIESDDIVELIDYIFMVLEETR